MSTKVAKMMKILRRVFFFRGWLRSPSSFQQGDLILRLCGLGARSKIEITILAASGVETHSPREHNTRVKTTMPVIITDACLSVTQNSTKNADMLAIELDSKLKWLRQFSLTCIFLGM